MQIRWGQLRYYGLASPTRPAPLGILTEDFECYGVKSIPITRSCSTPRIVRRIHGWGGWGDWGPLVSGSVAIPVKTITYRVILGVSGLGGESVVLEDVVVGCGIGDVRFHAGVVPCTRPLYPPDDFAAPCPTSGYEIS